MRRREVRGQRAEKGTRQQKLVACAIFLVRYWSRAAGSLAVLAVLVACEPSDETSRGENPSLPSLEDAPDFATHIAPLVLTYCAVCHRPGQAAPFSLLSYDDVAAHAEQLVDVTQRRLMPPWLPEPGVSDFAGERVLSTEQIATFARWVAGGMPPGDLEQLPPLPEWRGGWYLGEPDLIVTMPRAYTLGPDGADEYRNFLLDNPLKETRWVRAWEFRPGNPRAVHHGGLRRDRTGTARYEEEKDPEPGFVGDTMGELQGLSGWFEGWNPGKIPFAGYDDMAWPLEAGTDLVLELHLARSGKPEVVRSEIGLYFADAPPKRHPIKIRLGRYDLDIPAGEAEYVATDKFVLPAAVEVLAVSPHAHYLAREMEAIARLPDGTKRQLLRIPRWDFDWQGDFRYREPVSLPKGTEIAMRFTYDNSKANVRNPSQPPVRVVYGPSTTDEMCGLWFQILPTDSGDADDLRAFAQGKDIGQRIATLSKRIEAQPDDAVSYDLLGTLLLGLGKADEAARLYRKAIAVDPRFAVAQYNLGLALQRTGRWGEAYESFSRAIRLREDYVEAWSSQGAALVALGRPEEALRVFDEALRIDPDYATAWAGKGGALAALGRRDEALVCLDRAVAMRPGDTMTVLARARILGTWGRKEDALRGLAAVLELRPENAEIWSAQADVQVELKRATDALRSYERAIQLRPRRATLWLNKGIVLRSHLGRPEAALECLERALILQPEDTRAWGAKAATLYELKRYEEARLAASEAARRGHEGSRSLLEQLDRERRPAGGQNENP